MKILKDNDYFIYYQVYSNVLEFRLHKQEMMMLK